MATVGEIGRAMLKPRFLALFAIITLILISVVHRDTLNVKLGRSSYAKTQGTCSGLKDIVPLMGGPDGSRIPTAAERLLRSEAIYQKDVQKRHSFLKEAGFGTNYFNPWAQNKDWMPWWWYFQPSFTCPHDIQRVGRYNDGGKWLCGMSILERANAPKCVIYSLGVFDDSSFESEMMSRTNCEVWAFDGSVDGVAGEAKGNPRIHFSKVFIGDEDKIDERGYVWKTLATVMKENGHTWIDVLKVDIEGSEFQAMDNLMKAYDVLPFSQLQIEIHLVHPYMPDDAEHFGPFLTWFERLEAHHLRPFWSELNLVSTLYYNPPAFNGIEYSFINVAGEHRLLKD